jgi:hypothetical protein
LGLLGCGGAVGEGDVPSGFPDVQRWGQPVATVHDDDAQTSRRIYRSPDGQAWAKVHHPLRQLSVTTRIDVRRLTPGAGLEGWAYTSWDPARRALMKSDAQTCFLCHSMAPRNGTYSRQPR